MKKLVTAIAMFSLIVLASCGASETDFKTTAQETAKEAAEDANPGFTAEATCEEPSSTDVGTTFSCTVTYSDGTTVDAPAEILEDDKVGVEVQPSSEAGN